MDASGTPDTDTYNPVYGSPVATSNVVHTDGGFAAALKAAGEVPFTPVTT